VANLLLRRMCQLSAAFVVCAVAVQADTFRLPNGLHAFGGSPEFTRPVVTVPEVTGIQAIVNEFQVKSQQNKPAYAKSRESSNSSRAALFGPVNRQDQYATYAKAVYLAAQLIGVDRSTSFGKVQSSVVNNALWSLFTRPDSISYGGDKSVGQKSGELRFWAKAENGKGSAGARSFPSINIWKPWQKGSRESVPVPEPSLASQLAFDVLVLAGLGVCLRRRGLTFVS
jgi:hypothetical protein